MKKWPAIPMAIFSVLGAIPVSPEKKLVTKKNALGITRFMPREIGLATKMCNGTTWQTFFHEMTHVALWDAGVHDTLKPKERENVCNAMGTYLAAAMKAGYITVHVPTDAE